MNVIPDTTEPVEENTGSELLDIAFGDDFFQSDTKSKSNKFKNKQMGPHQSKKLSTSKGNNQENKKATCWTGKVFSNHMYTIMG